jgi:hypothetical protein
MVQITLQFDNRSTQALQVVLLSTWQIDGSPLTSWHRQYPKSVTLVLHQDTIKPLVIWTGRTVNQVGL